MQKKEYVWKQKENISRNTIYDNVYICDFETRAGMEAIQEGKTWVWAWGMVPLNNVEEFHHGSSIETYMSWLLGLKQKSTVYFHNLKFDGAFIVDWLLKNNYEYMENSKKVTGKRFSMLMSDMGTLYSITIGLKSGSRQRVEIRDSLKKLPFSVDKIAKSFKTKYKKTSIDYVADRQPGYQMTKEELEYLHNDVAIIAEVLAKLYEDGLTQMTIGSDCLAKFKEMFGKQNFEEFFPHLDDLQDHYSRKAYRGGWCYLKPDMAGNHQNGCTYDVNSLYPSMMHSNRYKLADGTECRNLYPVGEGEYFKGEYVYDETYPLYVIRFDAMFHVKPNHVPTVQIKNSSRFAGNEYLTKTDEIVELFMTSVDFELFIKHYDCSYLEVKDGYKYRGRAGLFDKYIDHFFKQKKEGEGAVREEAKLFLNNLYGKFAQKIQGSNKHPYLNGDKISYTIKDGEDRKPVYMPVGAFVTAYSRRFTITAAQQNFDHFIYSDTDSIHTLETPKGIVEHKTNLCCWDHEADWSDARFVRQKTYAEKINGKWEIKCAGMNKDSKDVLIDRLKKEPIDIFSRGLVIEGKKLRQQTVDGGILLIPCNFQIRA